MQRLCRALVVCVSSQGSNSAYLWWPSLPQVCEFHLKQTQVEQDGVLQRFCQQCSRWASEAVIYVLHAHGRPCMECQCSTGAHCHGT